MLSNTVAVVGEINHTTTIDDLYRSAVIGAEYENLAQTCLNLLSNDQSRRQKTQYGFELIQRHPQKLYTSQLL